MGKIRGTCFAILISVTPSLLCAQQTIETLPIAIRLRTSVMERNPLGVTALAPITGSEIPESKNEKNDAKTTKLHTKLLDLFDLDHETGSRSIVVRFDRLIPPAGFKNKSGSIDKPTYDSQNSFKILPDRTVDLFVVYKASPEKEIKIEGGRFRQVGLPKILCLNDVEGESNQNQVTVVHYQSAQGLYYGATTIKFNNDSQTFTIARADSIDESNGLKIISILQCGQPNRLGLRSPITTISRTSNPAGAFVTFDAIAVIDSAANNPSLGAGITWNFSIGARQDENLEGRYGFPLLFSMTVGLSGLDSSGVVGGGRPFFAPGLTIRFRT